MKGENEVKKKDVVQSENKTDKEMESSKKGKRKLFLWLWLFPPYGIYILYKERRIHPALTTIFAVLLLCMIGLSVDMVLNPNRVHDEKAKEVMTEFIGKNAELNMGDFRDNKREGTVHVNKKNLDLYKLYTTKGVYFVYLTSSNGLEYQIQEIEQAFPNRKEIYKKDKGIEIYPENILQINKEKEKYGEYKSIESSNSDNEQVITTTKGTYQFFTRFQQVLKVVEIKGEEKKTVFTTNAKPDFSKRTGKYVLKNKNKIGDVKELSVYSIEADKQVFDFTTSKGIYRIQEFYDGRVILMEGTEEKHDESIKK
ncbi:hypothetical protein DUD82_31375 [Bacillus toyonensis]